ncbi:uncharacterized protein LOC131957785 [Physella acuta]|uniref:uncharacterized protein LOC131957785 n=1 Tax=Physella acuta TaxID=109671 RepID=UPI0027DDA3D2|nr:uncharacterized protein LOC131957785 [Physella acuta]
MMKQILSLVFATGIICLVGSQAPPDRLGVIKGIPCQQSDIVNMMGRCMIKFTQGHGVPVLAKMRKSFTCETSTLNCTAVMETRVCLAKLSETELSLPCRPYIDAVSDHQFSVFNIPCRVSHLRATCMALFTKHGLTQF